MKYEVLGVEMNKDDSIYRICQLAALLCMKQKIRIKCINIGDWDKRAFNLCFDAFLTWFSWHVVCLQMFQSQCIKREGIGTKDASFFNCNVVTYELIPSPVWSMLRVLSGSIPFPQSKTVSHLAFQALGKWELLC